MSGTRFVGVDALAPSSRGEQLRMIGVVASRAVLVGGRVTHGVSWVQIRPARGNGDLDDWGYYLSSPGSAEITRRYDDDGIVDAFLEWQDGDRTVALSDIALTAAGDVHRLLRAHEPACISTRKTQCRFALQLTEEVDPSAETVSLTLVGDRAAVRRAIRLHTSGGLDEALRFIESVALHDWLVTNLGHRVADAPDSCADPDGYTDAVLEHFVQLAPLWDPAPPSGGLAAIWTALDSVSRLSATWTGLSQEIRDAVTFAVMRRLPLDRRPDRCSSN